jgi:hypothetical protein
MRLDGITADEVVAAPGDTFRETLTIAATRVQPPKRWRLILANAMSIPIRRRPRADATEEEAAGQLGSVVQPVVLAR